MSQAGQFSIGTGSGPVGSVTSNAGVVVPDGGGNINIVGGNNITTTGAGNTLTIDLDNPITGNVEFTGGTFQINSGTNAINISNDATNTTVNVGTGAGAKLVTVGSTNGASSLALKTGTADFSLASATGTIINALDTGEITYPLQPMFLASQTTDQTDVTGDGSTYTITFTNEIVDRNGDFDAVSTFTAPVTGMYAFFVQLFLRWDPGNNDCFIRLVTTGATYNLLQEAISSSVVSGGLFSWSGSCIAPLTATNTATVVINVTGILGLNVDIIGSTNAGFRTPVFSGYLIG